MLEMATGWSPREIVKHPTSRMESRLHYGRDWCRYYIGVEEKSKRTDYIYFLPVGRLRIPAVGYHQLKDKPNNMRMKAGRPGYQTTHTQEQHPIRCSGAGDEQGLDSDGSSLPIC